MAGGIQNCDETYTTENYCTDKIDVSITGHIRKPEPKLEPEKTQRTDERNHTKMKVLE